MAFNEFKSTEEGQTLEESIRDNRKELTTIKQKVKNLTEQCNGSKKNIDLCKSDLDKKQDERKTSL
jgi:chromosome segregation ATPase